MKYILFTFFAVLLLGPVAVSAAADEEIKDIIEQNYVDRLDPARLEGSIEDVFSGLDRYSHYMTEDELDALYDSIDQKLTGIGITIQGLTIQSVLPSSPAEEKGLQPGDIITEVDDQPVRKEEDLVELLSDDEGTSVTLTLDRNGNTLTVDLVRSELTLPAVQTQTLSGNIGYMNIATFSQNLNREIADVLHNHDQDHWILDIRNNPGGYVSAARELAGFFPDVRHALLVEHRGLTEPWDAISQDTTFTTPTSLLINGSSASASEITAGFYKDYNLGTIYGQTTFGKGLMQRPFELEAGGAVLLSVNRFYTPERKPIQNVGVAPHEETYLPLIDAHYDALETTTAYPSFSTIDSVAEDKVFTVELNSASTLSSLKEHTKVWQLGGREVEADVRKIDEDTFTVDPVSLVSGSEYVLTIEPGWTTTDGASAPDGILQRFSVRQ